ncbi:MAG: hypothetical protein KDB61_12325 [Planctomycetes bacterium]|nr:hypothetical protein [Planctomycetota bacterium]
MSNLIGGFLFGCIGFVAFTYGKRQTLWTTMFLGLALMLFPYFITSTVWIYVVGIGLTGALYLFRE